MTRQLESAKAEIRAVLSSPEAHISQRGSPLLSREWSDIDKPMNVVEIHAGSTVSISDTDLRALKTQCTPSGGSASGLDPSPCPGPCPVPVPVLCAAGSRIGAGKGMPDPPSSPTDNRHFPSALMERPIRVRTGAPPVLRKHVERILGAMLCWISLCAPMVSRDGTMEECSMEQAQTLHLPNEARAALERAKGGRNGVGRVARGQLGAVVVRRARIRNEGKRMYYKYEIFCTNERKYQSKHTAVVIPSPRIWSLKGVDRPESSHDGDLSLRFTVGVFQLLITNVQVQAVQAVFGAERARGTQHQGPENGYNGLPDPPRRRLALS
ncbi:hypothetical protein BJV74DRAFT_989900 [Russula compacta]|nr:hypothetical protein BJV74DRAFT_989900 [Russula compacta]